MCIRDRCRHRRRDRQLPPDRVPLELADPAADRRVRLVPGRVIGGVVDVSYTHLDVYKRQVPALAAMGVNGVFPAGSTIPQIATFIKDQLAVDAADPVTAG